VYSCPINAESFVDTGHDAFLPELSLVMKEIYQQYGGRNILEYE
jgi:hypothetical protein